MIHVGKLIRASLENQNISPTEACEILELSRTALYSLYKNETPSTRHLFKLYDRLGVNLFSEIGNRLDGGSEKITAEPVESQGKMSVILNLNEKISNRIIQTLIDNYS